LAALPQLSSKSLLGRRNPLTKAERFNVKLLLSLAQEDTNMIGMGFIGFLILLVISVVVSATLHYGFKYYVTPGPWSFCSKVVIGWIGAWLGSPVLGNWPHMIPALHYDEIWFIPAILGAIGVLIVAVDLALMARSDPRPTIG
jgi:uncharacterized membrane protein YeaQ/YmgE (transglycosylase-associated protein family)